MKLNSLFVHTHTYISCIPQGEPRNISEKIDAIREKLKSIRDGNINVSAYDTAWVALVKRLDGGPGPQFPTSIDWITKNQMPDGSWGDCTFFMVHDRIINTLACIVALKSWNIRHYQCQRGTSSILQSSSSTLTNKILTSSSHLVNEAMYLITCRSVIYSSKSKEINRGRCGMYASWL
jgi:hypothetical protein